MNALDVLSNVTVNEVDNTTQPALENKNLLGTIMVEIIQNVRAHFAVKGGYALS